MTYGYTGDYGGASGRGAVGPGALVWRGRLEAGLEVGVRLRMGVGGCVMTNVVIVFSGGVCAGAIVGVDVGAGAGAGISSRDGTRVGVGEVLRVAC